jgi:hypothetical protein
MQSSLPTAPTDQNIKAVDPAGFAEIAKIDRRSRAAHAQLRSTNPAGLPISRKRLVRGPGVLNDPFFPGGLTMGNPKITIVAYCVAAGFILAVAFHSSSKTLTTASGPTGTPISDLK